MSSRTSRSSRERTPAPLSGRDAGAVDDGPGRLPVAVPAGVGRSGRRPDGDGGAPDASLDARSPVAGADGSVPSTPGIMAIQRHRPARDGRCRHGSSDGSGGDPRSGHAVSVAPPDHSDLTTPARPARSVECQPVGGGPAGRGALLPGGQLGGTQAGVQILRRLDRHGDLSAGLRLSTPSQDRGAKWRWVSTGSPPAASPSG